MLSQYTAENYFLYHESEAIISIACEILLLFCMEPHCFVILCQLSLFYYTKLFFYSFLRTESYLFLLESNREVVDSMFKAGEAQAKMKEIQVALDAAILDKQNAESEAAMEKEKGESRKTEIKRLESMVSTTNMKFFH